MPTGYAQQTLEATNNVRISQVRAILVPNLLAIEQAEATQKKF